MPKSGQVLDDNHAIKLLCLRKVFIDVLDMVWPHYSVQIRKTLGKTKGLLVPIGMPYLVRIYS